MKLFVWDLHGVLEQGNHRAAIDISNTALDQFGHHERFTYEDGIRLYGLKWYEYFEWRLPGTSHEYCLDLQNTCFKLSERDIDLQRRHLTPTEHALDVLARIAAGPHDQILISNTRASNLAIFLDILGLDRYFDTPGTALAVDAHLAGPTLTKSDLLAKFLDDAPHRYDDLVIVGDSPSDMRLAQVAGGVTYMYCHPDFPFRSSAADHRIRDLRAVLAQL